MYTIVIPKKIRRSVEKLPDDVQDVFWLLVDVLREKGAIRKEWKNFSDLGKDKYHCHVQRKYVVCWKWKKKSVVIDVYYAGSREGAPY
jgi:mRNA-degrading endonuclease RelE of RelBE toxin-antitoxin system